jgi:hypothetical protein
MPQNRDSETLLDIQRAAQKIIQFKQELEFVKVPTSFLLVLILPSNYAKSTT